MRSEPGFSSGVVEGTERLRLYVYEDKSCYDLHELEWDIEIDETDEIDEIDDVELCYCDGDPDIPEGTVSISYPSSVIWTPLLIECGGCVIH